jgi:hypothetical protein
VFEGRQSPVNVKKIGFIHGENIKFLGTQIKFIKFLPAVI